MLSNRFPGPLGKGLPLCLPSPRGGGPNRPQRLILPLLGPLRAILLRIGHSMFFCSDLLFDRCLSPTWPHLGLQHRPKNDQKWFPRRTQKRDPKKLRKMTATGVEKCLPDGPGDPKNRPNVWEGCRILRVSCFSDLFKNTSHTHTPPPRATKSAQEGPKLASKTDKTLIQKSIIWLIGYWYHLGATLAPSWGPSCSHLGAFWGVGLFRGPPSW